MIRQFLDTQALPQSIETWLDNLLKASCPDARDLGGLLKNILMITKCNFIFIDAMDECPKSEWEVLLEVLQDILISCSSIVKIFLAVRQGIVEEIEKIVQWHYEATMNSSEVKSNIRTYIEGVLAEKRDCGKLVVGNPELINEITDVLVQEANGMLVCRTNFHIRILTKTGSFGLRFKLKRYATRSVTVIFATQFKNFRKISLKPTITSCQELQKWGMQHLPEKCFFG